ncbi:MAG: hypothetical protein LBH24_02315, partial [Clostridiales bacterium]|nr:hypothetical protein [Clostridiales bacterium]
AACSGAAAFVQMTRCFHLNEEKGVRGEKVSFFPSPDLSRQNAVSLAFWRGKRCPQTKNVVFVKKI